MFGLNKGSVAEHLIKRSESILDVFNKTIADLQLVNNVMEEQSEYLEEEAAKLILEKDKLVSTITKNKTVIDKIDQFINN